MKEPSAIIHALATRYFCLRLIEVVLSSLGASLIGFSLLRPFLGTWVAILVFSLFFLGILWVLMKRVRLRKISDLSLAHFLNRTFPELQESADLWLTKKESLTSLEQLQREKLEPTLQYLAKNVKLPHHIPAALLVCAMGVAGVAFMPTSSSGVTSNKMADVSPVTIQSDSLLPASIQRVDVTILPPSYTRLPVARQTQWPLKIKQGSQIHWAVAFTTPVDKAILLLSRRDSLRLNLNAHGFEGHATFAEPGFYQLEWVSAGITQRSPFFPIEVAADEPPIIEVQKLAQFVEVKLNDRWEIDVNTQITDDFGITNAHIIATVSKGSGESIKFREEKLSFVRPVKFSNRTENAQRPIDLRQLGLEPGDELYFYIEAFDNRQPLANRSRTETFFIAVQDTSAAVTVADEGLGVDLMPEYFRSQRQIIIDSEKLLAEKKKIKKEEFNATSNELGYDQKVLRLRYGQFLGEEFETAIARVDADDASAATESDVTKQFGHQHDTENEHNLVADKKKEPEEQHEHHEEEGKENPFEAFVHSHDNAEEATFFIQSIKAKLRAALTLMWDAELYLRMYQPETSLPYQYKILKLLKEISNDSRVYVHRTGFDPPPLKEEKRLTGDLTEVRNTSTHRQAIALNEYPAIRETVRLLSLSSQDSVVHFSESQRKSIQQAGNEMAGIALQNPGRYFEVLSQMKTLVDGERVDQASIQKVLAALWSVLPKKSPTPGLSPMVIHPWDEQLIKEVKTQTPK